MRRHFSFAGMQRCGNHAIIDWWKSHFPGWYFRNNILGESSRDKPCQASSEGQRGQRVRIDSWENFLPGRLTIARTSEPLIIIMRDPYNWWASWFQYTWPNPNVERLPRQETIKWYIEYAEYAYEIPVKQFISFNHWSSCPHYRYAVEQKWDIPTIEDTGGQSKIGAGGALQTTDIETVNERWKSVAHMPLYYEPLLPYRDKLREIARNLFNMSPPERLI